VKPYASVADLQAIGLPESAFVPPEDVTQAKFDAAVTEQLLTTSAMAETYLRGSGLYALPLTGTIPVELTRAVCHLMAPDFLAWRGYNPDQFDAVYAERAAAALAWLKDVAKRIVVLDLPAPPPGTPTNSGPGRAGISTKPKRGW